MKGKIPNSGKLHKGVHHLKNTFTPNLIVNGFLWLLWAMSKGNHFGGIPWPVWSIATWGIGLAFDYFDAYHGDENTIANNEYEKLKRERE